MRWLSALLVLPLLHARGVVVGLCLSGWLLSPTATALSLSQPTPVYRQAIAVPMSPVQQEADESDSLDADASNSDDQYSENQPIDASDGMVNRSRKWLAGYLDNLSGDIDSFFVDTFFSEDILEDDVGGSRAKLSFYTRREAGEPVDYKFGVSVNLELPRISERLNLLLESSDEEAREADPLESVENNNYSAALRFIFRETDRWKTSLDSGVRWGMPPDPFTRFRARRYAWFSEWEMKATQTLYWYSSKGWGEDTSVQLNYPLNIEKLFRINAKAGYLLDDDFFKLSYSASLYHELSSKAALAYVAGASGDTELTPTFYSYTASLRYRRKLYQDWVFGEISPELIWERDSNYETTPVIMFRIETVISR